MDGAWPPGASTWTSWSASTTCGQAGACALAGHTEWEADAWTISPDGTLLASAGTDKQILVWDLATGSLRHRLADQPFRVTTLAFSPDSTTLVCGGKTVRLWDARTGKPLRELFGHLKRTQSITFSADGRLLVSGGSYGTTNAWEVATGRHLVTLFAFPERRNGTVEEQWLAYHPDGYYDGSPGVDRLLAWRVGDELLTAASLGPRLHRPDRFADALRLRLP
jgi:WD40 repeat protein